MTADLTKPADEMRALVAAREKGSRMGTSDVVAVLIALAAVCLLVARVVMGGRK